MTFEEVLDQAMAMLQRRGRLTYRTLQLHFQLDDEHLEALKDELIYGQRLAVDEDGRVLVWTGGADVPPNATPPVLQPAQPSAPQAVAAPAAPPPADAERRQLTVLFCDLVDSTRLASQLDPEDYREVVRAYQQTCAEVIQRFEGHIAQYLGDGLLVYFGYPQAHEDDAQRAVRTGLDMVQAMATLNHRLAAGAGGATGRAGRDPYRPGDRGRGRGRQPPGTAGAGGDAQSGGPPPGTGGTGYGRGQCGHLPPGAWLLYRPGAGGSQPEGGHGAGPGVSHAGGECGPEPPGHRRPERLNAPGGARVRSAAAPGALGAQPGRPGARWCCSVGRRALANRAWWRCCASVSSARAPHAWCFAVPPITSRAPSYPVIEHVQRVLHWTARCAPEARIEALEQALRTSRLPLEEVIPLFAALLSLPHPAHYPPLNLPPQRQRQKTHDALVAWLLAEAEQQPVLAVWEDLHWADPSTLEFLGLVLDQVPTARMLTLLTCRPEFHPPWASRSHLTQVTLTRLGRPQVEAMITSLTGGKALPAAVVEQIVARTDGVPLFVEELVKMILESGLVREEGDHYVLTGPLPPLAIPSTLHDSLMARLDRLATVKEVAQLGATIGRTFAYELLQAVSPLDEATLQQGLRQLVEAELVYQRGAPPQATYMFKHALIQEAAYQSLLRSTRQQFHQRIAQVLEARFPATVETQPELVAQHYTEAGLAEQAVVYWQRAGQQASDRSAHLEAISHFTTGIELLQTLPETPARTQQALTLYLALGAALQVAKGQAAPEVEHAYIQARALCQQVGETPQLVPVLFGLWRFYLVRSQLHTARELGDTLLRLAQRTDDPALAVIAHYALGSTWLFLGALPAARQHLEAGIARYTPDQSRALMFRMGLDPGVGCRAYAAWTLWLLGYPEQALARLHEALALAHELSHPYSLALVRWWAAYVYQWRRDVPAVYEHAEAAVVLATEQGFPFWEAAGTSLRGWALAMQGQSEAGMVQVRQGIAAWRATGAAMLVPYFCTLLAEVAAHLGHTADGLQALAEAHTLVEQHEERWWEAEVCRLRGVLLLRQPGTPQAEAETWLQRALDVARRQEAKSLELRAAMSLSRLWQQQGKQAEARDAAGTDLWLVHRGL